MQDQALTLSYLLKFSPHFEIVGNVDQFVGTEELRPGIRHIFSNYKL